MLPTLDDYREYGRKLGRERRERKGQIRNWVRFWEMKGVQLNVAADLRALAGYSDVHGAGTYRMGTDACREAYEALIEGYREAAT